MDTTHPQDPNTTSNHQPPEASALSGLVIVTAAAIIGLDRFGLPHQVIEMFLAVIGQVSAALLNTSPQE